VTATPIPTQTQVPIGTASPTPTLTDGPTPTSAAKPRKPRVKTTFAGRLTAGETADVYRFSAGAGRLTASVDFRHVRRLQITVLSSTGHVVLRRSGRAVLSDTATLHAGRYRLRVSGARGASYTVQISRVAR
jgi:hypothetical protein